MDQPKVVSALAGGVADAGEFFAPVGHFRGDGVADVARFLETLGVDSGELRRIGETPMQPLAPTGHDRATFGAGLVADGDDVVVALARAQDVPHRFRRMARMSMPSSAMASITMGLSLPGSSPALSA